MRVKFLCAAVVLAGWVMLSAPPSQAADALGYLEGLKGTTQPYLAPSEIDPRYTIALYVNRSGRGPNRQRMWVLNRDSIGGEWRLAMWDKRYWKKKKLADGEVAPFSWLVSTGRHYRGDRRSGPTPAGIFAIDERRRRYGRGWMQDGMIHVMHIDLHYTDGRVSGVAFHGTTPGRYRRLGSIDSHGCVRMHQSNALALLNRITGKDGMLAEHVRWGEVPRFWQREKGARRYGYTRDGTAPGVLPDPAPSSVSRPAGTEVASVQSGADQVAAQLAAAELAVPAELTKVGFRAIAVIFDDPGEAPKKL